MLQFSPRPLTTLIGREDARKSGRCITRFAVGKLKMRVMPVTIRTRAGAGLNCNVLVTKGAGRKMQRPEPGKVGMVRGSASFQQVHKIDVSFTFFFHESRRKAFVHISVQDKFQKNLFYNNCWLFSRAGSYFFKVLYTNYLARQPLLASQKTTRPVI